MRLNQFVAPFLLLLVIASCRKDDGPDVEVVPPRLLSEVAVEDDAKIKAYLSTHFYNYEEFASPPGDFDYKIRIDTIAGENASKTPLIDQVQSKLMPISSSRFFGLELENNINHTYYYLVAREGIGASPTTADSVFVRYRGTLLNGTQFDAVDNVAMWLDLGARVQTPSRGSSTGGAVGLAFAMSNFKTGGEPIDFEDGTFTVNGYGIGAMFLPSGVAYFNTATGNIPRYSPLIFTVDLLSLNETDHDGDGIPSIMEDLNNDGYLWNDNTDLTDEIDRRIPDTPNFIDPDDDGDGTPTREEIIINSDGTITFPDSNGNGIPDYLDKTYPQR